MIVLIGIYLNLYAKNQNAWNQFFYLRLLKIKSILNIKKTKSNVYYTSNADII